MSKLKMIEETEIMFIKGELNGQCRKCKEPTTGSFDSDEDGDEDSNYWVSMECVNCHFVHYYIIDPEISAFEYPKSEGQGE